jgi:hypothetical protein
MRRCSKRRAAELWVKLWGEQYAPVKEIDKTLTLDIVMALLVERDAPSMSVDSLASALRYVWIFVWETRGQRPPSKEAAGKALQSFRKENRESPKKWARERHMVLVGEEYGAHGYPRLDARQRGKYLYREYAASKGAKTKLLIIRWETRVNRGLPSLPC